MRQSLLSIRASCALPSSMVSELATFATTKKELFERRALDWMFDKVHEGNDLTSDDFVELCYIVKDIYGEQ